MKFTTKRLAAVAAALALGLSACGGGTGGTEGGKVGGGEMKVGNFVERDQVKDGGTFTTDAIEISTQFNTFHQDGTRYTLDVWRWYNPKLALFTPEGEWSFNDDYLTDFKQEDVDGNTKLTITFRDEAVFNDGTPMDWTTIEATWKASNGKDPAFKASSTDGYDRIKSVTKGDTDKTAIVEFDGPWPWWQGLFNVVLHPKVVADPKIYDTGYIEEPNDQYGAGPYHVKSYDKNAGTIVFERNPKWWGDKGKLDERIFRAMEPTAALNAFKNGEIDATLVGNAERFTQVKDMEGIEIYKAVRPSTSLMVLNADTDILKDDKVREAVMKSLDRDAMAKIRFQGLDYEEEVPGSLTLFSFQPGYEDNVAAAGIKYDPEAAKKLLDEAGWTEGDGGIREKDGEKLTLVLPLIGDDQMTQNLGKGVQAMMKEVGIDVQLDSRAASAFSDTITKKTFDMFMMGFASSDPFGMAYFCQIWCSNSELNKSGTGTPELDKKIQKDSAIADPDEQTKALNKLEVEGFQRHGIIPTFNGPSMYAVKKGMANFDTEATGFYVGKPQDMGWTE